MDNLTEKERQALRELVEGLKELYGDNLSRVILYGSKARGDAGHDSDIDVLVVLKRMGSRYDEIHRITEISAPISLKYDLVICDLPIEEKEVLADRKTLFVENVLKEGIELL
jgi:predicted nucleotidyltransferase